MHPHPDVHLMYKFTKHFVIIIPKKYLTMSAALSAEVLNNEETVLVVLVGKDHKYTDEVYWINHPPTPEQ